LEGGEDVDRARQPGALVLHHEHAEPGLGGEADGDGGTGGCVLAGVLDELLEHLADERRHRDDADRASGRDDELLRRRHHLEGRERPGHDHAEVDLGRRLADHGHLGAGHLQEAAGAVDELACHASDHTDAVAALLCSEVVPALLERRRPAEDDAGRGAEPVLGLSEEQRLGPEPCLSGSGACGGVSQVHLAPIVHEGAGAPEPAADRHGPSVAPRVVHGR
jgi:hypothetical protein